MSHMNGIWIAMVTPFHQGALDLKAAQNLAVHLREQDADGLVLCGTTGEAPALSLDEQHRLLSAVREAVGPDYPLMQGIGSSNTAEALATIRHFDNEPLTGILLTVPYYVRPSQEGIRQHFEAAAAATQQRLAIYNIPYRTGINMGIDTVRALCTNPQFIAIKESGGGDLEQLSDLIETTPLSVMCGEDNLIFVAACLGAAGAISAAAHIRPDLYAAMFRLIRQGDVATARTIARQLRPLIQALFAEPNPAPVKAALAMQGLIRNELRLPMSPATPACMGRMERLLKEVMELPRYDVA